VGSPGGWRGPGRGAGDTSTSSVQACGPGCAIGCQDAVSGRWRQLLAEEGATLYRGEAGLDIALHEALRIEVLHPGAELLAAEGFNDNAIVRRLSYVEASALLTGDITAAVEHWLLANGTGVSQGQCACTQ
jgi:beta-lactamase superfamily II metal-dependent hydrolase